MSTDIWVWISSILSLCIFSFLWKDSIAYRMAQNVFLGIGAGHGLAIAFRVAQLAVLPLVPGRAVDSSYTVGLGSPAVHQVNAESGIS